MLELLLGWSNTDCNVSLNNPFSRSLVGFWADFQENPKYVKFTQAPEGLQQRGAIAAHVYLALKSTET